VDVEEFAATMDQLRREREALKGAYADLQERMAAEAEATRTSGKRPAEEAIPMLVDLTEKLANFANIEREHADKLWALLQDTLGRLAEAYDLDVPPG